MNRFLCPENRITANASTANQFFQTTTFISIHVLPILALAGNSLIILVILTNSQLNRSSFSVYVKSMAVSDTLVLVLKLLSFENKTSKYFYRPSLCTGLVFLSDASVLLSVWTIVLITIERTLVVVYPLHIKKFVSACRARLFILLIATCSVLLSARILILQIDNSPNPKIRCQPLDAWQSYQKVNGTITEFLSCFIPLTIVITGNFITLYTVKRAVFQRHQILTHQSSIQKRQVDTNENQLMLMLLIVTLMFIVYFVPYTITNVILRWGLPFGSCFTRQAFEAYLYIRSLSELLKDFNFCTNFIIYCISGRRFRYALFSLIRRRKSQLATSTRYQDSSRQRGERVLQQSSRKLYNLSQKQTYEESQF
ncbi:hypothetical protein I4U23_018071 [Adineta vaga]|nr:hypothetical protein I4U23_018071 [Adineta vaga]